MITRPSLLAALALCLTLGGAIHIDARRQAQSSAASAPAAAPRLVVLLAIDQFRSDYAEQYGKQWTRGLKRLFQTSAIFPLGAYPYGVTKTCAGHATIGTGSLPRIHGMVENEWYDRTKRGTVTCTEDPDVMSVPFGGGKGTEKHSPRWLRIPTFADELRLQLPQLPRILSISLKARSSIGLGGRGGPQTMIVWEEDDGTWATSSAFTKEPWPEVDAYVRAHPVQALYGTRWTRFLPESAYLYDDDVPSEMGVKKFPHMLESPKKVPDMSFVTRWERSPFSDEYIADMAITLAGQLKLGQEARTDLLSLSFSALDLVGHDYGPRSHEVQDVLARLDHQLGNLFDMLDKTVGPSRYVVAFSADHGVPPIPEQAAALGMNAGRFTSGEVRRVLQSVLTSAFGEGTYVAHVSSPNISFAPGVIARIEAQPDLKQMIASALLAIPGASRVYWGSDIAAPAATDDPILGSLRMSYYPGRSGDLALVPRPYWIMQADGTTHGSPYEFDRRVPVVLMGAGIKPGRYLSAATPADLVPTLAWLTGITLAHTDGRVLTEALVRQP